MICDPLAPRPPRRRSLSQTAASVLALALSYGPRSAACKVSGSQLGKQSACNLPYPTLCPRSHSSTSALQRRAAATSPATCTRPARHTSVPCLGRQHPWEAVRPSHRGPGSPRWVALAAAATAPPESQDAVAAEPRLANLTMRPVMDPQVQHAWDCNPA